MTRALQTLKAMGDGILTVDLQDRITFANPSAAAMLTRGEAEDMIGQPIRTYLPFLDAEIRDPTCWREDGTCFPIEYRTDPIRKASRIVGNVVTFRDITQRRAAERARDEVIGVISHELRSPLTSIRAALGLLASGTMAEQPEAGQRMLEIALVNTDRLIRLVNETLDLERMNAGLVVVANDLWADELVSQAVNAVNALAHQAGITLEVIPVSVQLAGDGDRLVQVLMNLLTNAIKFSPPGGTVRLDVEQSVEEIIFRVRDQGRGIPPDKLETIFDKFAQVEEGDRREKGGTGLGLAICRSIVTQHNGQIWAESSIGGGTTVCVALPCEPSASPGSLDLAA